jgi:cysteine desulfurase
MDTSEEIGRGVVRISLGLNSPLTYYENLEIALSKAYTKLAKVKSF